MAQLPVATAAPSNDNPAPSVDQLIQLLTRHREALLRHGPMAADEIEACSRAVERAFATRAHEVNASSSGPAGTSRGARASVIQPSRAELARLQDELQATQATLSKLAASNRRALDTLFGEACSYSRQGPGAHLPA